MCRYRLRLDSEVIIWRCLSTNGPPFVWRESGNDVQHDAHAQKAENHTNLNGREKVSRMWCFGEHVRWPVMCVESFCPGAALSIDN